jgi:Uma2 family endonuclease
MPVEVARRRFDVDEYHRMAQAGILAREDRVELIDGEVVAMTPVGPRHNAAVDRANRVLGRVVGDKAIVRVQGSIRLGRSTEPEPDLALLRPRADFYASDMPGPADVLLVIEIAESSLVYDRDVKSGVYAGADVLEYWLVDLGARTIQRHTQPRDGRYRETHLVDDGQTLAPEALPDCVVAARDLMA